VGDSRKELILRAACLLRFSKETRIIDSESCAVGHVFSEGQVLRSELAMRFGRNERDRAKRLTPCAERYEHCRLQTQFLDQREVLIIDGRVLQNRFGDLRHQQ